MHYPRFKALEALSVISLTRIPRIPVDKSTGRARDPQ